MIQFYSPDILSTYALPESESQHCVKVLRMKEGDEIYVTDGNGHRFICLIEKANFAKTEVRILKQEPISDHREYTLVLAVAPTKNADRMEWMIEKAVEIGVDEIILLKCERSERKNLRLERLHKVMVSAMKQSLGVMLPKLTEVTDFKKFVSSISSTSQKYFGYCSDSFPKREFVKDYRPGGEVVVMIGPEGDFSQNEVTEAIRYGFYPVTFGQKRLRTETAGVFVVCAVKVLNDIL